MTSQRLIGGTMLLLAGCLSAEAQTSLFDQKPVGGAVPAAPAPAAAEAAVAPKAKPKPKPRGPTPARAVSVSNVSGSALTEFVISADGKQAKLPRELGNGETVTMRLPPFKSCTVTVIATFERAGEAEQMEQDICKDRKVRLTNAGG